MLKPIVAAVAALLTVVLVGPAPSASARVAPDPVIPVPSGATITITGHGFGHGHGMSQYGAQGAALQGLTAQQIVAFYYPHTTLGKVTGQIRVLITANTGSVLTVLSHAGLKAQQVGTSTVWDLATLHPAAHRWRLTPVGANRNELDWQSSGAWYMQAIVAGNLQFTSAGGVPTTLLLPDGSQRAYRGTLRSVPPTAGSSARITVNVPSLESYLDGVVPSEMPASWSPAAVQAQAIAARTYAAYERAQGGTTYDICDTTACQVYGGYTAEQTASNRAVSATSGQVVLSGGSPAFTQFASSDGGWTAAGGQPYLPAQADPYDGWSGNPYHTWTTSMTAAALAKHWPAIGTLTSIQVTGRDGNGDWGGRVTSLMLDGTKGAVSVSGDTFRSTLALKSNWISLSAK